MYYKLCERTNGKKYYSYLIIYVDDILCIDFEPRHTMNAIGELFCRKPGSVESPKMYLGSDVRKWEYQASDGTISECYALGANSYVKEAIKSVKSQVIKYNFKYPKNKKNMGAHLFLAVPIARSWMTLKSAMLIRYTCTRI